MGGVCGLIQACPSVRPGQDVCPGLFAHLTDFVPLLITFKHFLGMLTKKHTHTRRWRAVRSSLELILVTYDKKCHNVK